MNNIPKVFIYSFLFLFVVVVLCINKFDLKNNSFPENETTSEIDTAPNSISEPEATIEPEKENEYVKGSSISETTQEYTLTGPDEYDINDLENYFYYTEITQDIFDRIYGLSYKIDCPVPVDELRYVSILHFDFNGEIQSGELICNKSIAQDLVDIFTELYKAEYPIEKIRLVDEYNADDTLSMLDNNTSCFNYRTVDNTTTISKHGLGMAIDINPFYNPYIKSNPDGSLYISPSGSEIYADRTVDFPHKINESDLCYQLFTAHGFKWGGKYKTIKDYQHFYREN